MTGAKSRSGSHFSSLNTKRLTAKVSKVTSSMCPSGGDSATCWVAMMPPEVTRFSTMNGWPSSVESDGARMRATRSLAPPGLAGTTRRTVRAGYCAPLCTLRSVPTSRTAMRHILAIIACLLGAAVQAQDYPVRPIRLIVPIGPGGGTDILARHMAQKMTERLRSSIVVENRPGAGSIIGTDYVAKAPPDGYTLLVGGIFNMVMNKALVKNLPYEPLRDFVPLGYISAYPFALVARADLPAGLAEFVQYARERPGKLTYGSAGLGTLQHVWGTILVKRLGLAMVHLPFNAAPAVPPANAAGRIDLTIGNLSGGKTPRGDRGPEGPPA